MLESNERVSFELCDARLVLGFEELRPHELTGDLRTGHERGRGFAGRYSKVGSLECRHRGAAHPARCENLGFKLPKFSLHHLAVSREKMIGYGSAAAEHVGPTQLDPRIVCEKLANGLGGQLSVGVGGFARGRIDGVVAGANLVAVEDRLAGARGHPTHNAKDLLDLLIVNRGIRKKRTRSLNIDRLTQ